MPDIDTVRLLISDTATPHLFTDPELQQYLTLEDGSVKRAAAQALDTIASSEALVSKVIRTQDLTTDGAKVADALRKHATALRAQADAADQQAADDADEGFFDIIPATDAWCGPELTER